MRRLLVSIIALSLFYQVFGYFIVFNVNALMCKKEMKRSIKAGLKENEMLVFLFSTKEFTNLSWLNKKEFVIENTMYDVVKTSPIGKDSIKVYCINDKKETELFANLSNQIDQNSDLTASGKPISKVLLKLLKIKGLLTKEENCVLFTALEIPYIKHNSPIVTQISNVKTPPPRRTC